MKGKDLLTLAEFSPSDLEKILDLSSKMKRERRAGRRSTLLEGRTQVLIFQKPSTRTRVSFEIAMEELGGHSVALSSSEMQLGRGETIEDTGRVLSRYTQVIVARVEGHEDVARLARSSAVPVINGLSDSYHPVQILADLLTLRERRGRLDGAKVAWVGDGNNVCRSWMFGAAMSGIEFVAAIPKGYRPPPAVVREARALVVRDASVTILEEPAEAVRGADCVVTDAFVSMGFETERDDRVRAFIPRYRVTQELLLLAKKSAIFEHCLPAHRGEEVTAEVIEGSRSAVLDEAENRLHTTKALLCFLLLGEEKVGSMVK